MGKLTAFATGMGEGYLAGKRYKDNKARMKEQDDLMRDVLLSRSAPAPASDPNPEDLQEVTITGKRMPKGMANGGMVGGESPMPNHSCRMSWQRTSFKK